MNESPAPDRPTPVTFWDQWHPLRGRHPALQPARPLIHAVVYYPLLLPWPLLLYLIVWNRVLTEYDAFTILWNPAPWSGVLSGIGAALILGGTLLAVFLLDQSQRTLPPALADDKPSPDNPKAARWVGARVYRRLQPRGAAIPRWAFWVLWLTGVVGLLLPALVPERFAKRGTPPLFQLNYREDGTGAGKEALRDRTRLGAAQGLPEYRPERGADVAGKPGVAEAVRAKDEAAFRDAEAQMRRSRWWFPIGVSATAVLFVALRLLKPSRWATVEQIRGIAWWVFGMFAVHYALMLAAHSLLGNHGAALWEAEWLARGVVVALALAGIGYLAYRRVLPLGLLTFVLVVVMVLIGFVAANSHGRPYCGFTGAPAPLIGLFGFLTAIAGWVTWLSGRGQWWLSAVAGVLVIPFLTTDFQRQYLVPGLPNDSDEKRVSLEGYGARRNNVYPLGTEPPATASDADAIRATAEFLKTRKRPMVVVAVSGGASASALYTADVLFTLEMKYPGFVEQVRLVTGASGGMVGAAYFVASFRNGTALDTARRRHRAGELPDKEYQAVVGEARRQALEDLGRDFLGPLVQRWVYQDMPLYFFTRGTTNDRGRALEQGWQVMKGYNSAHGDGVLHVPFHELRPDEEAGRIPSLVFAPMMIEDGRQLLISNLNLDYLVDASVPTSAALSGEPNLSHTALELTRLFPDVTRPAANGAEPFRLSTAARLNASFPFFSPAARLPTKPYRHLVDAGYFDNYGTLAAMKWVARNAGPVHDVLEPPLGRAGCAIACGATGTQPPDPNPTELVFLQLHCYEFESETQAWVRKDEDGGKEARPEALHSLVAPIAGALSSRRSHMVYRGDERVDGVNQLLEQRGLPRFERFLLPCDENPSLNWVLTPDTRRRLRRSVWERVENMNGRDAKELGALIQWGVRPGQ